MSKIIDIRKEGENKFIYFKDGSTISTLIWDKSQHVQLIVFYDKNKKHYKNLYMTEDYSYGSKTIPKGNGEEEVTFYSNKFLNRIRYFFQFKKYVNLKCKGVR